MSHNDGIGKDRQNLINFPTGGVKRCPYQLSDDHLTRRHVETSSSIETTSSRCRTFGVIGDNTPESRFVGVNEGVFEKGCAEPRLVQE